MTAHLDAALPLEDDGYCFGCGRNNPIGLKLTFEWRDGWCVTRYVPDRLHQGWAARTHGGILALVLDEVLSRAALTQYGLDWVTAELVTRLHRPAPVRRSLIARSRVETVRSRLIVCRGDIRDEETGERVASGEAKMMRARA